VRADVPTDPQPLYIWPGTERFVFSEGTDGIIRIPGGSSIEMFCSSGWRTPGLSSSSVIAQCVSGQQYLVNGQQIQFSQFVCNNIAEHTAQRTGNTCNGGAATLVRIGFQVGTRFITVINVCFDEGLETTLYTQYEMTPPNARWQINFVRPSFIEGIFFPGRDMNNVYSAIVQRARISSILGSTELGAKYVQAFTDFFLARGHLAARADFVNWPHQHATFYFINAAPQWQVFNGFNWERAEDSVRMLIRNRRLSLDVFTGTFGIMTLNDINGIPRQIFLTDDANNNPTVPVPKIYYRIVIDRATNHGLVLIGVNNPYVTLEEIHRDYIFCHDISDQATWVNWDRFNIINGYGYVCEVNEFARVVGHLPELRVTGLLL
jgi:hypothetical protein